MRVRPAPSRAAKLPLSDPATPVVDFVISGDREGKRMDDGKTPTEVLAERADAWKMARSLLRGSDLAYDSIDVITLSMYLLDQGHDE